MSAEVKVKVSILSAVQTGLAQVQSQFNQFRSQINSGFAGLFAVGAITAGFVAVLNKAKEIAAASKNLGISPEDFQRVTNLAKEQGVELAKVQVAWTRLIVNQQKAKEGNEQLRDIFKGLGISMDDVTRLAPAEMFYRMADAIHTSDDHTKALASSVQLMGRGAGVMFSILEKGSKVIKEQGDAIPKMSDQSVASLKKLSDQYETLKQTLIVYGGTVVSFFKNVVEVVGQTVGNLVNTVERSFSTLGEAISLAMHGHFIEAGKALGHGIHENLTATIAEFKATAKDTDFLNQPKIAPEKPNVMGEADESKSDEAYATRVKTLQEQLAELRRKAANDALSTEEKINALVVQRLALLKKAKGETDEEEKLKIQIEAQKIDDEISKAQEIRVQEKMVDERKAKPTVIADSLARVGGGGNVAALGSTDEHLREAKEHTRLLELIEKNTEAFQLSLNMR